VNRKQIAGLLAVVVGVALIVFSVHSMNRISSAKSTLGQVSDFFSDNPMKQAIGGELHKQASKYDTLVQVLFIGGIVLTVVGGCVLIFGCKKNKR
jgi:drug/metabolite transporter (DMT)-like permease